MVHGLGAGQFNSFQVVAYPCKHKKEGVDCACMRRHAIRVTTYRVVPLGVLTLLIIEEVQETPPQEFLGDPERVISGEYDYFVPRRGAA